MGWRDRLGRSGQAAPIGAASATVDAIRAATAAAANEPLDLSYITEGFLAQAQGVGVEYATDVGEKFEGAAGDAIIETYGGEPLGRLVVLYGHHAALFPVGWRFGLVNYDAGAWTTRRTIVRGSPQTATIVGRCDDGSPLWEFRV